MSLATYDQVLKMTKHLNLPEQLRLLEDVTRLIRRQVDKVEPRSIMELEGLGAEIWRGVDAQAYVDEERASWES